MNESAFPDKWAWSFVFQVLKICNLRTNKKKRRKRDCHASMDMQLCNGFQTAQMFYLSCNFNNCNGKSKPKIVLSFTTKQKVLFKLKAQ